VKARQRRNALFFETLKQGAMKVVQLAGEEIPPTEKGGVESEAPGDGETGRGATPGRETRRKVPPLGRKRREDPASASWRDGRGRPEGTREKPAGRQSPGEQRPHQSGETPEDVRTYSREGETPGGGRDA
jgi:hypothetical protein